MLDRSSRRKIAAILAVTFLLCIEVILRSLAPARSERTESIPAFQAPVVDSVTFLAFGDINLGRKVGQRIIHDDVHFPFRYYSIAEDSADIVFANLECQVSDQKGETGHPKFNLIFTAPPEAVQTLASSGIDIVSTANNHAVDYGIEALLETIDNVRSANIQLIGTSKSRDSLYEPLIFRKNNIKFAIFAVTSFVNMTFKGWSDHVAQVDTAAILPKLRAVRDSVDVVVMSYHGGIEYAERPGSQVQWFSEWCVRNGVDLFLGHHPHVTFGIRKAGRSLIVHSLGNFIFYQPQHYWTQRSYGVKFRITKHHDSAAVSLERILPVNVSLQTRRLTDTAERVKLLRRTQELSNIDLTPYWK